MVLSNAQAADARVKRRAQGETSPPEEPCDGKNGILCRRVMKSQRRAAQKTSTSIRK